jgi:hypothetical protein
MGLFVVVKTESRGSGIDVVSGSIGLIARCDGAGAHIALAVSVLMSPETVAERLLAASRANTFNFKFLSTSSISVGNGVPLSFGHSRSSRRVFSSICSRVTVSGLDQCAAVGTVSSLVLGGGLTTS